MAPLASEPRQVRVVLDLPKRKALYTLVVETTDWMRSQLFFKNPNQNPNQTSTSRQQSRSSGPSLLNNLDNDDTGQTGPPLPSRPSAGPRSNSNFSGSDKIGPLRAAALSHFDTWRSSLLQSLKDLLSPADSTQEVDARRQRSDRLAKQRLESPAPGENLIDFGDLLGPVAVEDDKAKAVRQRQKEVAALQSRYHAIPTRLTTVGQEDREEVVVCLLLMLLSSGKYTAESRTFLVYLCSALELPLSFLNSQEAEVATSLVESSTSPEAREQQMSAAKEAEERKKANQVGRFWKVGLASVAGAAIIGVTGGLAAPAVAGVIGGLMGSVGLGGVASFLGVFWMNGALVGTLFGALGAQMTGEIVDQYAREVEDFAFLPLSGGTNQERLRLTIGINGWLTESLSSLTAPWLALDPRSSNLFALRYEVAAMLNLGNAMKAMVTSAAWTYVKVELLKRTVLATLWSALWPISLLSMASALDNPFSLAKNRSEKAGKILADALINRVQGERPVTLIGYSLGARVIYSCLRTLAERRAFGLVDEVILIGAPVPSDRDAWEMMRSVVSGKLWNVCSGNDYLLGFIYRTSSIQLGVAGLQEIKGIEGVENLDLTGTVKGHMRYPDILGKILEKCGVEIKEGFGGDIEAEQDLTREEEIILADMEAQGKLPAFVTKKGNQEGGLVDFEREDEHQSHHDPPPKYAVMDPYASSSRPLMEQPEQQEQTLPLPPRPQPQRTTMTKPTSSLQASSNNPLGYSSPSSSSKPAADDDLSRQFLSGPSSTSTSSALSDLASLSLTPQQSSTSTTNAAAATHFQGKSSQPNPHPNLLLPSDQQQQKPLGRSSTTTTSTGSDFSTVRGDVPAIHRSNTAPIKQDIPRDIPLVSSSSSSRPSPPVQSKSEPVKTRIGEEGDISDDDTGRYGIKMVDNDDSEGELGFVEPIPMEEEEGSGHSGHSGHGGRR
ncbi:DUF726-domain-containing protein [Neurospora crassa]|uniref:DUF726 domain-containing protein n=1 Tax=Neurospora crassa (strain ATCC 24698 / 74-OR23-1A / CBS 708.71 / DSM 1257 / FGSC 987) TaxID=367110 RepID=Q7SEZ8_NEUCR|nr:DUF726 domain-containing protein [Neurospora crassa OR74A]EAA35356.1 DUF726 domain-containing protein [Neurospora crassa OR74A]KHE89088.1 DUF726-domain-containing protein [Neurospora crassa]|eukprot:XP_964592.1 DUF726 domain-containing protein [Neurospora crassa OR74A]